MPPDVGDEEDFPSAGLTVRNITAEMAIERYLPSRNGVLVTGVRSGYPFDSARPNIEGNDIITALAGRSITDMASFRSALSQGYVSSLPGDRVLVAFRRHDEKLLATVVLKPEQVDNTDTELPQPWIGIRTQVLQSDIAAALGSSNLQGFRITEIYPYTNASKSGLKVGDIITKLDDTELNASQAQDSDEFRLGVQALSIGDIAKLTVERSGSAMVIPVTLEPEPDGAARTKSVTQKELEFSVREISNLDRFANHWTPGQKGLLVTDVTSGGYAMIAGLEADDLIVSIDGVDVLKLADLKTTLDAALKTHPTSIEVFVHRGASTQFVFIEPDWTKITGFTEQ
jgi:serine protease Do